MLLSGSAYSSLRNAEGSQPKLANVHSSDAMRLLLVEDDAKLVRALARGLGREGYAVDIARDGHEALEQAEAGEYEVILLDVMLPGPDGFAVCESLRLRGDRTPVLMLTARADVRDRIRGLNGGADDYLVKPFDFGELVARLRALTPESRRAGARGADRRRSADRLRALRRHARRPERRAVGARARAADLSGAPAGPGCLARAAARAGLGARRRPVVERRRRLRRLPAQEARAAGRPAAHPDRARHGIRAGVRLNLPIRVRLTAWYAVLLAGILVAIGAFLVLQLRSDLQGRLDSDIRAHAGSIGEG